MFRADRLSCERSNEIVSSDATKLMQEVLDEDEFSTWVERSSRLSHSRSPQQGSQQGKGKNEMSASELHKSLLGDLEEHEANINRGMGNEIDAEKAKEFLDPFSKANLGISASYLAVGFGIYFIQTPLQFYMVDTLDATAAQQSVVIGLLSLPWAMKLIFGFTSDSFPIYGMRRKPYFIIGWTMWAICNACLAIVGEPNIAVLAFFIFTMTISFLQADVCTDAMIVERSKAYETDKSRGTLQATGYTIRFFGAIIGSVMGAVLYNKDEWGWGLPIWGIFLLNGLLPAIVLCPFVYDMVEVRCEDPPVVTEQLSAIWKLVQRKAVWRPCTFIYIYNLFVLVNPAWNSYLVKGLGFSDFELGMLGVCGTVLSFVGIVVYKRYLFNTNFRTVYLFCTLISCVFAFLQLVLVLRWNGEIGMGSTGCQLLFAMGSYGVVQFLIAIQFLPSVR